MVHERKDTETQEGQVREGSDGQYEMTEASTPLYEACEAIVRAKQKVMKSKDELIHAEEGVIEELKKVRKSEINHKGDIIVLVKGKTIEDHIRFKKS